MRRKGLFCGSTFTLLLLASAICMAALSGPLDPKSIIQRIKPVGEVTIETTPGETQTSTPATSTASIGEKRYEETCKMCHETGLAGAPKLGDKKDWVARVAQGEATLVKHAIEGLKAMPPKGGCTTCDDEEIKQSVEYMLSKIK